jgi:uncharacterized protein YbjQ (UPF0145 family)
VDPSVEAFIQFGFPLVLLVTAYFTGGAIERRHYASIRKRERESQRVPAITFREPPPSWDIVESSLVTGSVVVSVDYFKRFLAGLRHFVGGRVKSYESLLDRARREALLRLKEEAISGGYNAIVNVRLETTRMANGRRNGQGIAGLEVLAFGTALALRRDPT